MENLYHLISQAPWWLYAVAGLVLLTVFNYIKTKALSLVELIVLPAGSIFWSARLLTTHFHGPQDIAVWLLALTVGTLLGLLITKATKNIPLIGNSTTFLVSGVTLAAKYILNHSQTAQAVSQYNAFASNSDVVPFAVVGGLLLGRTLYWLYQYKTSYQSSAAH